MFDSLSLVPESVKAAVAQCKGHSVKNIQHLVKTWPYRDVKKLAKIFYK